MHSLKNLYRPAKSILALAIAGVVSASTMAQNDDLDGLLEEIEVVATYRGSLQSALEAKRNATNISDSITADDMGSFPAANLAEALQGITGVSMSRSGGVGEYVSIRGMDPALTKVTINGRSVSMTANESDPGAAASLSFFSPDMFSSAEVSKSARASDVTGGVGGTVNLTTRKPLDIGEFKAGLSVQGNDSTVKDDKEYSVGGFYNDVFMDDKLGFTLSGSYEDLDRRLDKIQVTSWNLDEDVNAFDPNTARQEARTGTQERYNISSTIQYAPTDELDFYADILYALEDRRETANRLDVKLSKGSIDEDTAVTAGDTVVSGDYSKTHVDFNNFYRQSDIENWGLTFGANWDIDDWALSSSISRSASIEDRYQTRMRYRAKKVDATFNALDAENPYAILTDGLDDVADSASVQDEDILFRKIGTAENEFRLDAELMASGDLITGVTVGYRFSNKKTYRREADVDLNSTDFEGYVAPELTSADFPLTDYTFDQGGEGNYDSWHTVDLSSLDNFVDAAEAQMSWAPSDTWEITDDVHALYAMADFEFDSLKVAGSALPVTGNFGIRAVQHEYTGDGYESDGSVDPSTSELFYTDYTVESDDFHVLPSANARITLSEDGEQIIRVAAARLLARPSASSRAPTLEVNDDLDSLSVGNPDLDPYLAWQYDISYEHYFGETNEGLFSIGVFYKDVENFFEKITYDNFDLSELVDGGSADDGSYTTYVNGGAATVTGLELSYQTPLTFLPAGWDNLGVLTNYTYVDSERETLDGETGPMPGSSRHTANFVLYYQLGALDTRIIYNYRDEYLEDAGSDEYVDGAGRLDLALRYKWESGLKLSADVSNLTEETELTYQSDLSRLSSRQIEGRRVSVGLSYDF